MRYRRGWDARLVRWLFLVPRWAASTEPSWFYPWITPTTRLHTLPCVTYHTSSSRRLLEFGASVSLACRPPRSRSRAGAEAGQEQVAEHRSVPRCAGCSSRCCRLAAAGRGARAVPIASVAIWHLHTFDCTYWFRPGFSSVQLLRWSFDPPLLSTSAIVGWIYCSPLPLRDLHEYEN
jgi:hypothetical protein